MLRVLTALLMVWFWLSTAKAQVQIERPEDVALYNHKQFVVIAPTGGKHPLTLKVSGKNLGEPAGASIYLTPSIKCHGDKEFKIIDLAEALINKYGTKMDRFIGGTSATYPYGQIRVCSLESVNFDHHRIFISVLESGSDGCRQDTVTDLIFPISKFCKVHSHSH